MLAVNLNTFIRKLNIPKVVPETDDVQIGSIVLFKQGMCGQPFGRETSSEIRWSQLWLIFDIQRSKFNS